MFTQLKEFYGKYKMWVNGAIIILGVVFIAKYFKK